MNTRMIRYLLSILLLIEAGLMVPPFLVAKIYGESLTPFLIPIVILLLISVPPVLIKPYNTRIYAKDGFVCVASAWILMSIFGAFPFVFSGAIPNFISAFFETVSGLTTTGATILTDIESLPRGVLFWRNFTQWIGGMGVLVFMLAILPLAGGQTIHLMRAEVPGPTKGKLVPKMKSTAMILYGIYITLTLVVVGILLLCGQPLYHAFVNAFSTAGTGGFSVLNASIAGYNSPIVEWVIAIFMLIFSINFNLYYFMLIGHFKGVRKDEELRVFLAIVLLSTVAISINTIGFHSNLGTCIRTAFFQVSSIISTAGFATADYNLWPAFSQTILVFLMFLGACAGSTTGGLKLSRIMLIFKGIMREIRHILRPRSVNIVRMNGVPVSEDIVRSAIGYLALHVMMLICTIFLISLDGYSFETNFTAALACLNNIGPGLKEVGPVGNYAGFSMLSQFLLSLIMILGRLEIIPMLVLLSPDTWKKMFGQKEAAKIRKLQRIRRLSSSDRAKKPIRNKKAKPK